jgi:hypothetical protein
MSASDAIRKRLITISPRNAHSSCFDGLRGSGFPCLTVFIGGLIRESFSSAMEQQTRRDRNGDWLPTLDDFRTIATSTLHLTSTI